MIRGDIEIRAEAPDVDRFIQMRADEGWGHVPRDRAEAALAASVLCVTACDGPAMVGMGRVVGDGHLVFYIQDLIVAPTHRAQGLGRLILQRIMADLDGVASPGAVLGLMAAAGVEPLYAEFGFERRPTPSLGAGMTRFV